MFNVLFDDMFNTRIAGIEDVEQATSSRRRPSPLTISRNIVKKALEDDPDLKRGYMDNIAMRLHDHQVWEDKLLDFRDKAIRDKVATSIINLIFDIFDIKDE